MDYCCSRIAHLWEEYKEHQSDVKVRILVNSSLLAIQGKIINFEGSTPLAIVKKTDRRSPIDESFFAKPFIRTISYREFVTSLSLVLLLLAFYTVIDYYSDEDWIENNYSLLKYGLLAIIIPSNHVIYKSEHKRPNNFIGRNLHDYIFLILFISLYNVQLLINGSALTFEVKNVGSLIILIMVLIFLIMVFELFVAVLKRLLRFFKWQII